MVGLRRGRVRSVGAARPGAVELVVELDGEAGPAEALAYPELTGPIEAGDRILVNTTAVDLGLGTGGLHLVVAVLSEARAGDAEARGRVMKARYTPLQTAVRAVEETHAEALEASRGLEGLPAVVAPLHSMVAPVAAGAKAAGAERVAYVMTDGAALAGPFSRLVPELRGAGLLDAFVTAGQAFGGELEAVTVWSALLAAKEIARADVVVVADGPGNLGTNTRWGVTALAGGHALNAVATLGGRPVAALRVSSADRRERHRGVSHHSLTILSEVCLVPANVAVPLLEGSQREAVWGALRAARLEERHQLVEVPGAPALDLLAERGVEVRSMGRSPREDPVFFLAAGAAGVLAGRMAAGSRTWRRDREH
jgi:hypothetical protein